MANIKDLQADMEGVFGDLGAYEHVPEGRKFVHAYEPDLRGKINHLLTHNVGAHYGHHMERMLRGWYELLHKHARLEQEMMALRASTNVEMTVSWDALPAASTSSTATVSAPYSGTAFLLCDVIVPSTTNPRCRLVSLNFSGIEFATPSQSQVKYSTNPGTSGTPAQQGMDLVSFFHDKTSPDGQRKFVAWTGWVFDPSAQIFLSVYNPDPTYAKGIDLTFMMRSNPCNIGWQNEEKFAYHSQYRHDSWQSMVDELAHGVVGISQNMARMHGPAAEMAARHAAAVAPR